MRLHPAIPDFKKTQAEATKHFWSGKSHTELQRHFAKKGTNTLQNEKMQKPWNFTIEA